MPAAVLLRGYAHRPPGGVRPWGVSWEPCLAGHRRHLLGPLRERFGGVDVYLGSYETPRRADVERDYEPVASVWLPEAGGSQKKNALAALDLLLAHDPGRYELVVVTRFDLELLTDVSALPYRPDAVNFLWREWNAEQWAHHNRVPDSVFLLPGTLVGALRAGIADPENISDDCLHLIYRPVARRCPVHTVSDEYHWSNPETDPRPNSVYRFHRVRD